MSRAAAETEKPARFRRSTAVKRRLMPRSHIDNFLGSNRKLPKEPLKNKTEICRFLLEKSLQDLGGKPILASSPEADDRLARTMASEVISAINREGHADAQHWYSDSLRKAVRIAGLVHPELVDDAAARAVPGACFSSAADARCVFFAALAITSQNMRIPDNLRAAREQYASFVATGRFEAKGYGTKGASIKANLEKFNLLVDILGSIGAVDDFLKADFTMAEIAKAAAKVGLKVTGGEMVDEPVHGAVLFGPKIGSFWRNLNGADGDVRYLNTITIDLWMTRTWGRWTGSLMRDGASAEQIARFRGSLKADRSFASALKRAGDWIEPDAIEELENDELLDYARKVHKAWENMRSALVAQGDDNAVISRRKAELDWPNAAESLVKTLGHPVDQPGTRRRRRWIRNVTHRAIEILRKHGYDLAVAEVQALLWVPEKALYQTLAGRRVVKNLISYDTAMAEVAANEGIPDERIRAEIRAVEQDRARGRADPGRDPERDPLAVYGDGEGPRRPRVATLSPEGKRGFFADLKFGAAMRMAAAQGPASAPSVLVDVLPEAEPETEGPSPSGPGI